MRLFSEFLSKYIFKYKIKYFYNHPDLHVDIEFANRTDQKKKVWVEPTCVEFELDAHTEYRITTHDKFFRIEFDIDDLMVIYLQHSFGFKLYRRPASQEVINPNKWTLDHDTSEIN